MMVLPAPEETLDFDQFRRDNRYKVNHLLNRILWMCILAGPAIALGVLGGVFKQTTYLACLIISGLMALVAWSNSLVLKRYPYSYVPGVFALIAVDFLLCYMNAAHISIRLTWCLVPLLSLLMCDSQLYGHARGDEIIREVALACRKQEAPHIRFARYGGDEFFGITRGLSDEELCEVARRICSVIRDLDIPQRNNPNGGRITLSVGLANVAITGKTDTILEIANYADKALYYAKNAGKNGIYMLTRGDREAKDAGAAYKKVDFQGSSD